MQLFIFPYLGGRWSGVLRFNAGRGPEHRDVRLEIKHPLFGIQLLLDSNESTSSTLVVHAERNPDFQRYRIYIMFISTNGKKAFRVQASATADLQSCGLNGVPNPNSRAITSRRPTAAAPCT
jgi:hypothetical protein